MTIFKTQVFTCTCEISYGRGNRTQKPKLLNRLTYTFDRRHCMAMPPTLRTRISKSTPWRNTHSCSLLCNIRNMLIGIDLKTKSI